MSDKNSSTTSALWLAFGCLVIGAVATVASKGVWLSWLPGESTAAATAEPSADPHAGHDHGTDVVMLHLSDTGLKNIGFQPLVIKPQDYQSHLTVPAMVVERPGKSQMHITAPLTGVVEKIHSVPGAAVEENQPLFELRLTHEDLVSAQRDFLKNAESLKVVERELARLQSLGEGVIAGRRVLEQQYEQQKIQATMLAERQALLLHGLSETQIDEILATRRLFHSLTVSTPLHEHDDGDCVGDHLYIVQSLSVSKGEQIEAGAELASLADHCELHIEGAAFEDDAQAIRAATAADRKVSATVLSGDSQGRTLDDLEILYVADQVDTESRAFKFYLRLVNEVVLDKQTSSGKRVIEWRYKPGQRMEVKIPLQAWENQIVVPKSAVADHGAEAYVYRQNGDEFEQLAVHILHRDSQTFVLANDGTLFSNDVIAGEGAYQMDLAIKNQSGGAVDPHAGHSH